MWLSIYISELPFHYTGIMAYQYIYDLPGALSLPKLCINSCQHVHVPFSQVELDTAVYRISDRHAVRVLHSIGCCYWWRWQMGQVRCGTSLAQDWSVHQGSRTAKSCCQGGRTPEFYWDTFVTEKHQNSGFLHEILRGKGYLHLSAILELK